MDVLRAQVKEQQEKIARLERLLSRNSGNSSMPPSSDDQPGKRQPKQRSRRTDGRRKPGKQPGAPGAYLAWNDHPGKTVDHFPEGDCTCGADLAGAEDLGVTASHQVTDIPAQEAQTTQHDRHTVRCRCGQISGRLRSEKATRDRYALRGYLSTAAKYGISIFTAILGAITGNPWMPPIPDYALNPARQQSHSAIRNHADALA